MTDETAKALTEALNRLAAAIEGVSGPGYMGGRAINVHHQGHPYLPVQLQPFPAQPWGPTWSGGQGTGQQ